MSQILPKQYFFTDGRSKHEINGNSITILATGKENTSMSSGVARLEWHGGNDRPPHVCIVSRSKWKIGANGNYLLSGIKSSKEYMFSF